MRGIHSIHSTYTPPLPLPLHRPKYTPLPPKREKRVFRYRSSIISFVVVPYMPYISPYLPPRAVISI
jgi:hypothetical protein